MLDNRKNKSRLSVAASLCVSAVFAALIIPAASAQEASQMASVQPEQTAPAARPKATDASAKRYFIDFRSRSAQSYGHTFSVYGKLNAQGKIIESHVAGLSPISESPLPWMIGHIIPVPSDIDATDGDREDEYITASYRVLLNEAEYRKLVAYIKDHQKSSPMWHALFYNCNAWVGDVARYMGLKAPYSSIMLFPAEYITNLREINGGRRNLDPSWAGSRAPASDYAATAPAAPTRTARANGSATTQGATAAPASPTRTVRANGATAAQAAVPTPAIVSPPQSIY